jgi:hypothetical protein
VTTQAPLMHDSFSAQLELSVQLALQVLSLQVSPGKQLLLDWQPDKQALALWSQ